MKQRLIFILTLTALAYQQSAFGEDWKTLMSQAQTDLESGNLENAETEFENAKQTIGSSKTADFDSGENSFKQNGIHLAECLVGISKVKDRKGDYAESDQIYEMALNSLQKVSNGGCKSHTYADFLPGIAELYDKHGKPDQSELAWQQVIEIRTSVPPMNDPKMLLAAYEGYSKFLRAHGRPTEAEVYENKVCKMKYSQQ